MSPNNKRPEVIPLLIRDQDHLYKSFMPFLDNGGLFVETSKPFLMGQQVVMVVSLPDSDEKKPVQGAVAWITPGAAQGGMKRGVGVHFIDDSGKALSQRIIAMLGKRLTSDEPTYTA